MKRNIVLLIAILACNYVSAQGYSKELKAVNEYLKTFDNGYYGYLEIIDGYLYDRFKSGKYSKSEIKYLGKALESTSEYKVIIECLDAGSCVYSTYTDSYHSSISFSQSTYFNKSELVGLLNNLLTAYKRNQRQNQMEDKPSNASEDTDFDNHLSNIDILNASNSNTSNSGATDDYATKLEKAEKALSDLNEFLPSLDNGRYSGMEVTDGYYISRFTNGGYSKAKIEDIDRVEINTVYSYAKFSCKGNNKCVYSSITNSNHDYFNFNASGANLTKVETLLNNLLTTVNNCINHESNTGANSGDNNSTGPGREKENNESEDDFWAYFLDGVDMEEPTNTVDEVKYATSLKKLNDYLPTFNKDVYKNIEVKGEDIYFYFYVYSSVYYTKISKNNLLQNTSLVLLSNENKIKLQCKGERSCFWSSYSNGFADHFQFFPKEGKELITLQGLLNDFLNALK